LGLFDRPAEWSSLEALMKPPAIAGLTEPLQGLSEQDLRKVLRRLRHAGLIEGDQTSTNSQIDAHPLIRECEGDWLRKNAPDAWRAAHLRLYEHLTTTTEDQPSTLEGLRPLFAAVVHGCLAGEHQRALDDVYWRRIQRGNERFSIYQLGAFSAGLSVLVHLFEHHWDRPVSALSQADKAFLLAAVGFHLRAVGRLAEAVEPMKAACELAAAQEDWRHVSVGARSLSELHLALGDVRSALTWAEQAVFMGDRSGENFHRQASRSDLADAQHQAGEIASAAALFREAEDLQKDLEPACPLLYSLRGFQYCGLLLSEATHEALSRSLNSDALKMNSLPPRRAGTSAVSVMHKGPRFKQSLARCHEVQERARKGQLIGERSHWLSETALDRLTLARSLMLEQRLTEFAANQDPPTVGSSSGVDPSADIRELCDAAVRGLRQAGQLDDLPRGLLARADYRHWIGDEPGAEADLREAEKLAKRCGMRLHQTDTHLLRARFELFRNPAKGSEHLAQARQLIADTGYHRRDPELALLEGKLAEITAKNTKSTKKHRAVDGGV